MCIRDSFGSAPHPGTAAAVAAAHQMSDLAFDFGSGGAVVGSPFGVVLETTGIGETVPITPDTDPASAFGVGALWTQRTLDTGVGEGGSPVPVGAPSNGDSHTVGTGHGAGVEIDVETVFGEQAADSDRRLGLTTRVDVSIGERVEELSGAVRGVAIHLQPPCALPTVAAVAVVAVVVPVAGVFSVLGAVDCFDAGVAQQVADEIYSDGGVPGVGCTHRRVRDDLGVGIDRNVTLIAVKTVRCGLASMTGIDIDGGDHPIRRDTSDNPECSVIGGFDGLTDLSLIHIFRA